MTQTRCYEGSTFNVNFGVVDSMHSHKFALCMFTSGFRARVSGYFFYLITAADLQNSNDCFFLELSSKFCHTGQYLLWLILAS